MMNTRFLLATAQFWAVSSAASNKDAKPGVYQAIACVVPEFTKDYLCPQLSYV